MRSSTCSHVGTGSPECLGDFCTWPETRRVLLAFGAERARSVLEDRSGDAYDPRLAELAAGNLDEMLAELDEGPHADTPSTASRLLRVWLSGEGMLHFGDDRGDGTGLKSPRLREHPDGRRTRRGCACNCRLSRTPRACAAPRSPTTSASACRTRSGRSRARSRSGSGARGACTRMSRSALLPSRARRCRAPGRLTSQRLDGSGYHRGARGPESPDAAASRPAADCYSAMREARPHRPALARFTRRSWAPQARGAGGATRPDLDAGARRSRPPRREAAARAAGRADTARRWRCCVVRGDSNQAIGDGLGIGEDRRAPR